MVTIRDMVKAHILLRKHLGIEKIHLLMGGSMGGYQALEWCVMENNVIENLFLVGHPSQKVHGVLQYIQRSGWPLKQTATWKSVRMMQVQKV